MIVFSHIKNMEFKHLVSSIDGSKLGSELHTAVTL